MEDEEDLSSVLKPSEPETTQSTTSTTTTSIATPKQVFDIMTRQPPTTGAPTFPSQIESVSLDMLRPGLLAG